MQHLTFDRKAQGDKSMVEENRLKPQHQGPEDQAARPFMVKAGLLEPQSWRKVLILRAGVIARIRWYGRRYDALIQPAQEPACKEQEVTNGAPTDGATIRSNLGIT